MATNETESYLHPHIHLILNAKEAVRYVDIANEFTINLDCKNAVVKPAYDLEGLLGYFYDQNFVVTQMITTKPRGVKLLTASKGMKCGFPDIKASTKSCKRPTG
jgi:hypothetical protein